MWNVSFIVSETPMQDSYAEKIILRNCNSLTQSLHKIEF